MYPYDLHLWGFAISTWNAMLLVACLHGWWVFRGTVARVEPDLTFASARYLIVVYLSALSAQAFAYLFDAHTSLLPPPNIGLWRWYLDPMIGPKTLYGVLVLAPASVSFAMIGTRLTVRRSLDLWTTAILSVLAVSRVGCFLQGCCFGTRTEWFGVSFPPESLVHGEHLRAGWIVEGATRSLPVVPTQALEAVFLAGLALICHRLAVRARPADGAVFGFAVGAYSVFRFGLEFYRADAGRGIHAGLATSQWIALVVLVAASLIFGARRRRQGVDSATRDPAYGRVAP